MPDANVARDRIKLCEVTPHLGSGGIETRVARVLAAVPRDDFDLTWIGFGDVEPALSAMAGRGVKIIQFEKRPAWTKVDLALVDRMTRAFREIKPDVVRVHNWSTSVYGIVAARLAGVPHVIYESAGRESPEGPGPVRRSVMRSLSPMVDVFLTVCPYLARELAEEWHMPPSEVRVMPTGVDLARFTRKDRVALRQRFGIPEDAFVVGTIGMFRPVKRVDDIIEAGVRLLANHPKAHLLIIGSDYQGKVPSTMIDVARHAGVAERCHFPGRITGAENAIAAFDVFVNASSFEGASNAIIEAMATAIPVIATDVGGNPDVVIDGKTGHLVRVASPDQIYGAMEKLISDPSHAARLGDIAQKTARARHSLEMMTGAYIELFRSLGQDRARGFRRAAAKVLARRARKLDLYRTQSILCLRVDLTSPGNLLRDRDRKEMEAEGVAVHPLDQTTYPKLVDFVARESPGRAQGIESRYQNNIPGFVLMRGDRAIGTCFYVRGSDEPSDLVHPDLAWLPLNPSSQEAYTFDYFVSETALGAGRWFVRGVQQAQAAAGLHASYGYVYANNTAALWLYRTTGWKETGRLEERHVLRRVLLVNDSVFWLDWNKVSSRVPLIARRR